MQLILHPGCDKIKPFFDPYFYSKMGEGRQGHIARQHHHGGTHGEEQQMLTIIATVAAVAAVIPASLALIFYRKQNVAACANYCHELYYRTIEEILTAQSQQNVEHFRTEARALIHLFAYQFLLWKSGLLSTRFFLAWSNHNHHMLHNLFIHTDADHGESVSFYSVFQEECACDNYQQRQFVQYMNKLQGQEITWVDLIWLR